ncbi:MAG: DUF4214 domain-containing protein [Acetobacteraceae bacterium]|nr:DUF4214 domain-containing protein [Acetobacteraceae bacterium]
MATGYLVWKPNVAGSFSDPLNWIPQEAPTSGVGQTLDVNNGYVTVTGVPLDNYTVNLDADTNLQLINETIGTGTKILQDNHSTNVFLSGSVINAGDIEISGAGSNSAFMNFNFSGPVQFQNTGTIKVSGTKTIAQINPGNASGNFLNENQVTVDAARLFINGIAISPIAGSFFIADNGLLDLAGPTNSSVDFSDNTGQLVLEHPGFTVDELGTVTGFVAGDTINIATTGLIPAGSTVTPNFAGGVLTLSGPNGVSVGALRFAGNYAASDFKVDTTSQPNHLLLTTDVQPPPPPPPPPGSGSNATVESTSPLLNESTHGFRDAHLTLNGTNNVTVALSDATIHDSNLHEIIFLDGSMVYDSTTPNGRYVPDPLASSVARLYLASLGRPPELTGELGWLNALKTGGTSLLDEANAFYNSTEFQQKYGGSLSNTDFVNLLYQNVLGRPADQPGLAGWVNQLNTGTSRAQVLLGITDSAEFKAATFTQTDLNGIAFYGGVYHV